MADIERVLDLLGEVRNFLNEAPIDELEAVEKALGRNAPIHGISEVIDEVWKLSNGYAFRKPATERQITSVLSCEDEVSGNGRSQWFWFVMPNGDQVLGTYPQGDLYLDICND